MIIAKVQEIRFTGSLDECSYNYVEEVNQWLKQWTIDNNIEILVCENDEQAIQKYREYFIEWFKPVTATFGFKPEHFSFILGFSTVKNGFFYIPSTIRVQEYKIVQN